MYDVCIYVCIYIYMYVCIYVWVYVHMYVRTYEGWLISKVSYQVVLLVVGGKKRLHMHSVVNTM